MLTQQHDLSTSQQMGFACIPPLPALRSMRVVRVNQYSKRSCHPTVTIELAE